MASRVALLALLLASGASGRSAAPPYLSCDPPGPTGVVLRWRPDVDGPQGGCYGVFYQRDRSDPVRRESCGATPTYELLGLGERPRDPRDAEAAARLTPFLSLSEPNTRYKVWVEKNGRTSNPVTIHTEAEQPG
jgi:hypothetical protein